jgi:hypothetical protein
VKVFPIAIGTAFPTNSSEHASIAMDGVVPELDMHIRRALEDDASIGRLERVPRALSWPALVLVAFPPPRRQHSRIWLWAAPLGFYAVDGESIRTGRFSCEPANQLINWGHFRDDERRQRAVSPNRQPIHKR